MFVFLNCNYKFDIQSLQGLCRVSQESFKGNTYLNPTMKNNLAFTPALTSGRGSSYIYHQSQNEITFEVTR